MHAQDDSTQLFDTKRDDRDVLPAAHKNQNKPTPQVRLELTTYRLTVERATNCATGATVDEEM